MVIYEMEERNIGAYISDCTYMFNKFVINRTVSSLKLYTDTVNTFIEKLNLYALNSRLISLNLKLIRKYKYRSPYL
jgi:hypothetical protein